MHYDFDAIIERRGTGSTKWDTYPADILPMWIADSDFLSPQPVIEAIQAVAARGMFGYSNPDGRFEAAYAGWMQRRHGWQARPEWVEWCPSLCNAIALMIRAFTAPGDTVAMLTPLYPPFINLCALNGRTAVQSRLREPDYSIDFADLEAKLALPSTTLFMLCNPHNPSGRVFTRAELEKIGELCLKHKVLVFSDEIHSDIVLRGTHIPFPLIAPELADITVVGMNASKTFNLPDLRSAAILASNPTLRATFAAERDSAKLGRCSLGVEGVIAAYTRCDDYADQLCTYLKNNIDFAVDAIQREIPRVRTHKPESTYLLWLDCRSLGLSQPELEALLMDKGKLALNSGTTFGEGGQGFMRMNLACPRTTVQEGLRRLSMALA